MATAKKPSPAQLAARKRFAEMAKAGVFAKKAARKRNPAKKRAATKKPAKPVSRPSQATGKRPSKRLVDRRQRTAKAPAGFYANPRKKATRKLSTMKSALAKGAEVWTATVNRMGVDKNKFLASFASEKLAQEYGRAYADAHDIACVVVTK